MTKPVWEVKLLLVIIRILNIFRITPIIWNSFPSRNYNCVIRRKSDVVFVLFSSHFNSDFTKNNNNLKKMELQKNCSTIGLIPTIKRKVYEKRSVYKAKKHEFYFPAALRAHTGVSIACWILLISVFFLFFSTEKKKMSQVFGFFFKTCFPFKFRNYFVDFAAILSSKNALITFLWKREFWLNFRLWSFYKNIWILFFFLIITL